MPVLTKCEHARSFRILDSRRVGSGKNIWFRAPLGKSDLVQSVTGSHTRVASAVRSIRSMWRRFVIGGNRKKLNFSRTPIRRVRAILIDNSIVATHCSARLITSHHSLFPIGNPSVARSRIGFGFSGDARKTHARRTQKGPFCRPRLFRASEPRVHGKWLRRVIGRPDPAPRPVPRG